ncbi:MAG: 3'(2'),5'-bisphosphate nucleotidase CysQ [Candidatus Promineifilaceae bacterium]
MLDEVIQITRAAGATIMGFYRDSFSVTDKAPDNPVTDADLAADRLLKENLRPLLPEAGWLSEETRDDPARLACEAVWVVDPLDGTKEFVLGLPEFAVSVALVTAGEPILAVVYNPASNELYQAEQGGGVFLNGRPVTVSQTAELSIAQVDVSRSERKRGEFAAFEGQMGLRTMGSIAFKLARLAAGQSDATWSRGPKSEWDICAGTLLVLEAGGVCVDLDNRPLPFNRARPKVSGVIASNGRLHAQVLAALAPHRASARTD